MNIKNLNIKMEIAVNLLLAQILKKRVLACRKAGKHIRLTSKEPSINEEYKEPQNDDRINTVPTASIKNNLIRGCQKAGNRLRMNTPTTSNKKSRKQSKDTESVYHKMMKRTYDKTVAKFSETNRRMTRHHYKEV